MNTHPGELVVILHGIGMSRARMLFINHYIRRKGYQTLNIGYPSLRHTMEECAEIVMHKIEQRLTPDITKIHFVAHSMGALVTLHILAENRFPNIGRAVLIAPPYRGSEVADFLQKMAIYKFLFGPAGAQLTTTYRSNISFSLPSDVEIGVIAGSRAYEYPFFLSVMKKTGQHDGLVSLASTRVPGAVDHITLRMSHSFLLEASGRNVVHFLGQGRFT